LQLVSPGISGVADSLTPTFEWKFGDEEEDDVCGAIDPDEVKEVRLYVSVFPKGEGLLPGDTWPELDSPTPGRDYNPNRVLTATWKEGVWTWNGGSQAGSKDQFTLPDDRMLTAGQEYHWAVEAVTTEGEIGTVTGKFETALSESFSDGRFSSVTVLTRGVEPDNSGESINSQINAIASKIQKAGGSVMKYNPSTGGWQSVTLNGNSWVATNTTPIEEKPLVLLADWMQGVDASSFYNAGFAEAAADSLFASLVKLDQQYGGAVGEGSRLYDANGNLIRIQGDIFNSPLHFIGLGQGAVVNTEIIQRLGTYFPHAGGTSASNRDLQMTTIDPYDFRNNSLVEEFNNLRDPEVVVWDNVTYADNYYQEQGFGNTLTGRKLSSSKWTADWNIELNELAEFDRNPTTGGPHQAAAAWYAGTANLNLSQIPSENGRTIYRRLGDLASSEQPWYTPDHTNANFSHGEEMAPWEGIGTGWFHSVNGGNFSLRPYDVNGTKTQKEELGNFEDYLKNNRLSVKFDNTYTDDFMKNRMWGDYSVPTLFNGNFDAIVNPEPEQNIPGWSLYNKSSEKALQLHLRQWDQITSLKTNGYLERIGYDESQPNYALKMGRGASKEIIHNYFAVPEWGDLRFNLYAPENAGTLKVSLLTPPDRNSQGQIILGSGTRELMTIDLSVDATGYPTTINEDNVGDTYLSDQTRIGSGRQGFETFHIDTEKLDKFRGQIVRLKFEVEGNTEIYLDDVFFKSSHLKFGNSTEARYSPERPVLQDNPYTTNLLIEKPQYAVAYDRSVLNPAWVSWQLNQNWRRVWPLNDPDRVVRPNPNIFAADPELPASWPDNAKVSTSNYSGSGFDQGHGIPYGDRNNHPKDALSTFLGTNLIPQSIDNNRFFGNSSYPQPDRPWFDANASAWLNIEKLGHYLVDQEGKEIYLTAGSLGGRQGSQQSPQERSNAHPDEKTRGNTNPSKLGSINIPDWTWITALVLDRPGIDPREVNSDTPAYTFVTPNKPEPSEQEWSNAGAQGIPHPFSEIGLSPRQSYIHNPTEWRDPFTWQVSLAELENRIQGRGGRTVNFLSNIPDENIRNSIKVNLPPIM
jgi:endonuclease G